MARPTKIKPPTVAAAPDIPRGGGTITRQPALSTRHRRGRDNIFPQLTAARLRRVLDGYRNGSLAEGAELFALMTERDHMLLNCRTQREKQVSRLQWAIVANDRASETDAKFVAQREFLTAFYNGVRAVDAFDRNRSGGLRMFLRQLMTAEAMGYSAHHLVWEPREDGTLGLVAEHVPLRFFENTTGELRYCASGYEVEGVALAPGEWLVHAGECLMSAASVLVHYKRGGMGAFVQFVDKFGIPALFMTTQAAAGSAEWDQHVEALESFYNDWAGVFSQGSTLVPVEPKGTGQAPHERLIDLCDRGMAILFRGGDLATLSNQKSHAGQGADLQQTSGQALLEDDAASVEDCLARLTEMALRWKFGPAAPVLATFQLIIPSPTEDAERLGNAEKLQKMGAGIDANELAREMDFEVVEGGGAAAPTDGATGGAAGGAQAGGTPTPPSKPAVRVANSYHADQPRDPKGSATGGQWTSAGGGSSSDAVPSDADYLAAVEAGDMEVVQEMVDKAAAAAGYGYSHRRSDGQDPRQTGYVVMFAEDKEANYNYGPDDHVVNLDEARDIPDWVADWYVETPDFQAGAALNNWPESEWRDRAMAELNPPDIVDFGGFWDNPQLISDFWNDNEARLTREGRVAFKTNDGVVVFDSASKPSAIKSAAPVTYDAAGKIVPLSRRFDKASATITNEAPAANARVDFLRDAAALLTDAVAGDLAELRTACLAAANAATDAEARKAWESLNARLPGFVAKTAAQEVVWADLIGTCFANGAAGGI